MAHSKYEDRKQDFIIMRCNGLLLRDIATSLQISLKTAERWNKRPEIIAEIKALKAKQYEELKQTCEMNQQERIKNITATIAQIDQALTAKSLEQMAPADLLNLKLKYIKGLREEENAF